MTAISIEISTDLIEAAGPAHKSWEVPVRAALEAATGQSVSIDYSGAPGEYVATISPGAWTLVVDLPEPANRFLQERWDNRGRGKPFTFELEVPDWIVALVARAANTDEQAQAVIRLEAAAP